jgi:hypothetical protein
MAGVIELTEFLLNVVIVQAAFVCVCLFDLVFARSCSIIGLWLLCKHVNK